MATAPLAAGTGAAYEPFPSPAWVWQVAWPRVTVTIRGTTAVRYRGERLPSTGTASENTVLAQLAADGALTRVLAVGTAADLSAAATAAATRARAEQAAADLANGSPAPAATVLLPVVRVGDVTIAVLP